MREEEEGKPARRILVSACHCDHSSLFRHFIRETAPPFQALLGQREFSHVVVVYCIVLRD